MPEKEGSEDDKTTKGVVKKKQKQMMGEEGYDTYRDNILMRGGDHRSKETKEKSYTPSKQPKGQTAAQKAAKGKSALELVKADITKKYGKGAIMDVGKKKVKEELDLTKIAEAFGGYLIELEIKRDKSGNVIDVETTAAERELAKRAQEQQRKIFQKAKADRLNKLKQGKSAEVPPRRAVATDPEFYGRFDPINPIEDPKADDGTTGTAPGEKPKPVKITRVDPRTLKNNPRGDIIKPKPKPKPKPRKPRGLPSWARKRKISPEAQKKLDAVMKGIEVRKITNPDRRSRKRVSASGTPFKIPSKPKSTPLFFTNRPKEVGDTGTGIKKSLKQFRIDADSFEKKLKTLKTDIEKNKPKKNNQVSIKDLRPEKEGDIYKSFKKRVKEIRKEPMKKAVIPTMKAGGKATLKTFKRIVKNPVGTAIAAGIAKDSFRGIPLPPLPVVQGGKVGKRTAG